MTGFGEPRPDHGRNMGGMVARVLIYWLLVALPTAVSLGSGAARGLSPADALGKVFALTGMAMLMLQPLLGSRFHWLERPFGLDGLIRLHRVAGIVAGTLLILHPAMLALGVRGTGFLTRGGLPWFLALARVTLAILVLYGLAAVFRSSLRLPFQWWLRFHGAGAPLILTGALLHGWHMSARSPASGVRWIWMGLFCLGMSAWFHLMLFQRLGGRRKPYLVEEVTSVAPRVWNILLAPPPGARRAGFLPGQFLFITLLRGRGLPREEHPFTISSSPTLEGRLSVTCKESGDFTSTIGKTRRGDRAVVNAPYGRFSYLLRAEARRMVFIAGGIGITPFMSMLRHMRDTSGDYEITLIYANRTEEDIAFRGELSAMEEGEHPRLAVVHVLSRPGSDWEGERGYADENLLRRVLGDIGDRPFYLCGPPPMMDSVAGVLRGMGAGKVYTERFAL